MNQCCLVCNNRVGASPRLTTNIFKDFTALGKSFAGLLSEILEKQIGEKTIPYSKVVCKLCHKNIIEYESMKTRLQALKSDLQSQFKCTLPKHNIDYDAITPKSPGASPDKAKVGALERKVGARVVLPASKLQPLPPDYVVNMGKLASGLGPKCSLPIISSAVTTAPSTVNIKVTGSSSVLTQSTKTTKPLQVSRNQSSPSKLQGCNSVDKVTEANINNALASILSNRSGCVDMNSLPKDFLSSAVVLTKEKEIVMKVENDDEENNDEQPMEIDQDCTLVSITHENDFGGEKNKSGGDGRESPATLGREEPAREGELELRVLPEGEGVDSGERQTIVMSREDGTILRVLSGQRLLFESGEMALVPADSEGIPGADDDGDDAHDSNDESQIELQVSGDEETANAIIAAAQEQGGAFIKVESGEMFRVKSVQSKKEVNKNEASDGTSLVACIGNKFKCLVCVNTQDPLSLSKCEGSASAIMQHMRTEHDARVYICHICKRVLRKRSEFLTHMEGHSSKQYKMSSAVDKTKVHECNVCKKKYNSRTLLIEHMNVHSGVRPHACAACGKTFASKYTYQAHLKTHQERPRPFKCSKCPKLFLTQQNLKQHEKTHSGVKDFVCNTCGKAFGTQHNLEVHGVVHSKNKPYICGICGKGFARRAEVKDHMRIHTGERPFACDICGATFAQRSNLHSHKRATHMDDKRYHCADCPKRFKRRRLLEYHIKASHTGERPLQCEVCHATFVYPEHYKKHVRIHSGERPYVCEVCGKSFNSRDNRNTHRFVHSDKKPYECLVCGQGYMRKQLLYAHMNTSGHLAESIVVNQPRVQKVSQNVDDSKTDADQIIQIHNPSVVFQQDLELDTSETKANITNSDSEPKLYITNDKKLILQDGKSTINLVQDSEDPTLLTLHNIDTSVVKTDSDMSGFLQSITMDQLADQTQMIAGGENGSLVRIVQIQLENGTSGWVAINQ